MIFFTIATLFIFFFRKSECCFYIIIKMYNFDLEVDLEV